MLIAVITVASLMVSTVCPGDEKQKLPTATRVLEGTKTTFPGSKIPDGVAALVAALQSCHDISDDSVKYTTDDLTRAMRGDHVHFVFAEPRQVEILGEELLVSQVVHANGWFWLLCGVDVVRCSKYEHVPFTGFQRWYRQVLPPD